MIASIHKSHNTLSYRILSAFIAFTFIFSLVLPPGYAQLIPQTLLNLPAPGVMVTPSAAFTPTLIKGLTIHPENPLEFDFIVEKGDNPPQGEEFNKESMKLVKYFLASLTVPEDQMWVNLSPHEKDRIISENLGATEMGKDMLAQDYILKQLTASLMYPENELGKKFWDRIYKKAYEQYGTTEIPMDTFNKVWIMPDKAVVYEHEGSVFIVESHLRVMLEQDYEAMGHQVTKSPGHQDPTGDVVTATEGSPRQGSDVVTTGIIREIILPEIEKEVNTGETFANLRQIYNSMILATWYKKNLRESLLGQVYVDKGKTRGVDLKDPGGNQKIYEQYLEAFKKGVYNYIKEDYDPATKEIVPRKYFSGGAVGLKESGLTTLYSLPQAQQKSVLNAFEDIGNTPGSRFNNLKIKLYEIAEANNISEDAMTEIVQGIENVSADEAQDLFVGETSASSPVKRVEEIKGLLAEIDKELASPGTGNLPQVGVISDVHGAAELFFKYVADAISRNIGRPVVLEDKKFPKVSIKAQLEEQGVKIKEITLKFDLLGDWADRGPYGVKVHLAGIELDELGLVLDGGMIEGNHDEWMENNLKGIHLPVEKGHNYRGHEETRRLVEEVRWDDPGIAKDRFGWWAARLKEYNASQKDLRENGTLTIGGEQIKVLDIRKKIKEEMYPKLKDRTDVTADQKKLIEELMGVHYGMDVFTGFNDIGMMPVQWWQERYEMVRAYARAAIGMDPKKHIWEELEKYTKEAAGIVRERFVQAVQDGKWWWSFFNDQNAQNYESPEWWAKDWLYHSGWGENVLKELNELEEGGTVWDETNYMKNPYLRKIASYKRTRYKLFQRNPYGFLSTHGLIPVDKKTGKMGFSYKGIKYEGDKVWGGLEAIEKDRSNPDLSLPEVYEGIDLVNSWYADKTTEIKPEHIAYNVNTLGLETIFKANGIGYVWFTGHNPQNKLIDQGLSGFKSQQGEYALITTDKGMSYQKYNDLGGYVLIDAKGIRMRGFSGTDFQEIVDNPATFKLKKDDKGEYVVGEKRENEAIGREDFLNIAEKQLKEEMSRLQSASSPTAGESDWEMLGVKRGDSLDTIKRAYWRLALQYHPDRNPGDKAKEDKFKDIANAYERIGKEFTEGVREKTGNSDFNAGASGESAGARGHSAYEAFRSPFFYSADDDSFYSDDENDVDVVITRLSEQLRRVDNENMRLDIVRKFTTLDPEGFIRVAAILMEVVLSDSSIAVSLEAINGLHRIAGHEDPYGQETAILVLGILLDHYAKDIVNAAADALVDIGGLQKGLSWEAAIGKLSDRLDRAGMTRETVVDALARLIGVYNSDLALKLVREKLNDENPFVRQGAEEVLARSRNAVGVAKNEDNGIDLAPNDARQGRGGEGAQEVLREAGGAFSSDGSYYGILGVARDAAPEEIKTAYRKLAQELHPDHNMQIHPQMRKSLEEQFKEINFAYEILSNPEARADYDFILNDGMGRSNFTGQPETTFDFDSASWTSNELRGKDEDERLDIVGRMRQPKDIPILVDVLNNDTETLVRQRALDSLSRIGTRGALAALTKADIHFGYSLVFYVVNMLSNRANEKKYLAIHYLVDYAAKNSVALLSIIKNKSYDARNALIKSAELNSESARNMYELFRISLIGLGETEHAWPWRVEKNNPEVVRITRQVLKRSLFNSDGSVNELIAEVLKVLEPEDYDNISAYYQQRLKNPADGVIRLSDAANLKRIKDPGENGVSSSPVVNIPIELGGTEHSVPFPVETATAENLASAMALTREIEAVDAYFHNGLFAPLLPQEGGALDSFFIGKILEGHPGTDAANAAEAILRFNAKVFATLTYLLREGRIRNYAGEVHAVTDWDRVSVLELGGGTMNNENIRGVFSEAMKNELSKLMPKEEFDLLFLKSSEEAGIIGATLFVPKEQRMGKVVLGVDVGGSSVKIGAVQYDENGDFKGMVGDFVRIKPDSRLGIAAYYAPIKEQIDQFREKLKNEDVSLYAGVGHPGKKGKDGKIVLGTNPHIGAGEFEAINPRDYLGENVVWGNDGLAQALGGYQTSGRMIRDAQILYLGQGTGLGVALIETDENGKIKRYSDDHIQHDSALGEALQSSSPAAEQQGQGARVKEPGIASDERRLSGEAERASISAKTEATNNAPGGIDLNPALLDMQIKRDGNGVPLPLPMQPIQDMHIEGFLPVIINVTPITNLPLLLGLVDTQPDTDETTPAMKAREPELMSALN